MTSGLRRTAPRGLAALRHLVRKEPEEEHCELCSLVIPEYHEHLVQPETRRLLCACRACAILFSGTGQTPYRRVPHDVTYLSDFRMTDELWNTLAIPIGLVFIFRSSVADKMVALYPSPAGPAESALDGDSWEEITGGNPRLRELCPDVEALLINRVNGAREYYIAPVDECYRLTGLIRKHWQGFSGGSEAGEQIRGFFEDLRRRSRVSPPKAYA